MLAATVRADNPGPSVASRETRTKHLAPGTSGLAWHARLIRTLSRASERRNSFLALRPCSRRSNWCFRPSNSIACIDLLPTEQSHFLLGQLFTYTLSLWGLTRRISPFPMASDYSYETYCARSAALFVDFATCEFVHFHLPA